jgi:hypothetical protein
MKGRVFLIKSFIFLSQNLREIWDIPCFSLMMSATIKQMGGVAFKLKVGLELNYMRRMT